MRILVITPKLPYPANGADEQDRFFGIQLLKEAGHEVVVIAKKHDYQTEEQVQKMSNALKSPVISIPYRKKKVSLKRFLNPLWIDGAAYEYTGQVLRNEVDKCIENYKPEAVWVDGSYAWPIARFVKQKGIYTIIRSLNRESLHLLSDEGHSFFNLIRFIVKEVGEHMVVRSADTIAAITPKETDFYTRIGSKSVYTLPLRKLLYVAPESLHVPTQKKQLHIMFNGATYSVRHNKKVAEYVIRTIAPAVEHVLPGQVIFHITGAKLPKELHTALPNNVIYEGYVADFEGFVKNMDVALAPSLGGEGMQQKIFEPITRGIPTITTSRGVVGYELIHKENVYIADNIQDIVFAVQALLSVEERKRIGENAQQFARTYFLYSTFSDIIKKILPS